jgi:hypothetical protein
MHCFNDRVREVPKISPDIILGRYFEIMTRPVDFISTSVNEGYYMKMFWNFPESIVEVNAVVRHFRHPWVLIRNIWQ